MHRPDEPLIEGLRRRVGVPFGPTRPPHNTVATVDAIRRFAVAVGADESAGVPPYFFETMGEPEAGVEVDPTAAPPLDVPMVQATTDTRWLAPIQVGDRVTEVACWTAVGERLTGRGPSVVATLRQEYRNRATGQLLVVHERDFTFFLPATGSSATAVPAPAPRPPEPSMAPQPLPSWHLGPIGVADVILFHVGWGLGGFLEWGTGPAGLAAMDAGPHWFSRGRTGAREAVVRMHWEPPRPHLYAQQQASLLAEYVARALGRPARLTGLAVRHRRPVLVGADVVLSGALVERPSPAAAVVAVRSADGAGEVTGVATATVALDG